MLHHLNTHSNDNPDFSLVAYDLQRAGTILGDGGGLLLLEDMESAVKRGAKIYCEITGYS